MRKFAVEFSWISLSFPNTALDITDLGLPRVCNQRIIDRTCVSSPSKIPITVPFGVFISYTNLDNIES